MAPLDCGLGGFDNFSRSSRSVSLFQDIHKPLAGLQGKRVCILDNRLIRSRVPIFFHIENCSREDLIPEIRIEDRRSNQLLESFNRFAPEQMLSETHGRINENRERVHVSQI